MPYRIEYTTCVVEKDIPALSTSAKRLIKRAIEERLTVDPIAFGKPLRYGLYGQRRLRVSDYRVIYRINHQEKSVTIDVIAHRSKVYE